MSKLSELDFTYCVECYFDEFRDCETHGCDSICRCSTIYNERITSVNMISICHEIYNLYFDAEKNTKRDILIDEILFDITPEINFYIIDRVLRKNSIWEENNWYIGICSGYYGEEINHIRIWDYTARNIEEQLNNLFSINNLSERIEFLLNLEYGKILPELVGCKYKEIIVKKEDIIFGSSNQYDVADEEKDYKTYYSDSEYNSIRGIVIEKGDKYRLIDGYHRCCATQKKIVRVLKAYK